MLCVCRELITWHTDRVFSVSHRSVSHSSRGTRVECACYVSSEALEGPLASVSHSSRGTRMECACYVSAGALEGPLVCLSIVCREPRGSFGALAICLQRPWRVLRCACQCLQGTQRVLWCACCVSAENPEGPLVRLLCVCRELGCFIDVLFVCL